MKFKVGDRVKVLDAIVDIHMIGKVAKVTKATENEVWLEGANKSWNQNTTFLKLVSNHVFKVGDRVRIKSKKYKPGSGSKYKIKGNEIGYIGYISNMCPGMDVYSEKNGCGKYYGIFDSNDLEYIEKEEPAVQRTEPEVRYYSYGGDWSLIPEAPKKKGVKTMLSILAKKLLDGDIKALVEVGWLDSELEVTEIGEEAVFAIFVEQNKEELAKRAKEELKKRKEK